MDERLTPDGSSIDFYAQLPPSGEAEIVHAAIPAGASVLELGCGTGRILRGLAALGHPVTGVDESPGMLKHAASLDTVCSRIQVLSLDRRFDAVLLASNLIHTADIEPMLASARRHSNDGATFVGQWHPPERFDKLSSTTRERDGVRVTVGEVFRDGDSLTATIDYQIGEGRWSHTFTAHRLNDEQLAQALDGAGFHELRFLTEDRVWFAATAR